jgi:hypothetical protein
MSPPKNGRFGSSSSSTGTVPKPNSRPNGGRRSVDQQPQQDQSNSAPISSSTLRHQSQQLERLMREQQAKLRSLEEVQHHVQVQPQQMDQNYLLADNLCDLRDKLRLLRSINGAGGGMGSSSDAQYELDERNLVMQRRLTELQGLVQAASNINPQSQFEAVEVLPEDEDPEEAELLNALQQQLRLQRDFQNQIRLTAAAAKKQQQQHQQQQQQQHQQQQQQQQQQHQKQLQQQQPRNSQGNDVIDQMKQENVKLKATMTQQQEQIQQLTQSLNQCFQALLTIQRDVGALQQQSQQQNNNKVEAAEADDSVSQLDSVSQQPDFESHPSSWEFDFNPAARHAQTTGGGVLNNGDPWNNYFTDPEVSRLPANLLGGSESGISGGGGNGALNNQVPPGVRANNYWDNFRSFSRQNRLSTSNQLLNNPISVAQVPPRQVHAQQHLPQVSRHSNAEDHLQQEQHQRVHQHHHHLLDNTVMVEPYFASMTSPSRPRRKQKINREQNVSSPSIMRRSSTSRGPLEAAMVLPMPQQQLPRQNEVQPIHHQLLNPMVTSIKRSIYSHINDLIAQNEERPDQLARIFHDLQNLRLPAEDNNSTTENNLEATNTASVPTSTQPRRQQSWHSMYDGGHEEADDEDADENNVSSSSFFKLSTNKRFNPVATATSHTSSNDNRLAFLASSNMEQLLSSGGSSLVAGQELDDGRLPLFTYEVASNFGFSDSLALLGAVGGAATSEAAASEAATTNNKKQNEEVAKQQNVAVPKNIQRNLISRERDGRKVRREKPRNMMAHQQPPQPPEEEAEEESFSNIIQFQLLNTNEVQSEMAEADQDVLQIPDDLGVEAVVAVVEGVNDHEPPHREQGLDRVPTRLSSSELDARRQEEEDSLQNLVDEVLNSSSEADFVPHGNYDSQLQYPK